MRRTGYSRVPVYHEDIDRIVGIAHIKDLITPVLEEGAASKRVSRYMRRAEYVPETKDIFPLLSEMQSHHEQMVIVVDEYGGTEGIATLEDILEELVGEIWDEHDEVIENFQKQSDGSFLISCTADLDDMYDLFQVRGTCDAATVSGWVLEQVGRVPEVGDHFIAEGLDVTVTKVEHRRVLEIRVIPLDEAE
jgi:CBS domain containing-hemolysin-like protein